MLMLEEHHFHPSREDFLKHLKEEIKKILASYFPCSVGMGTTITIIAKKFQWLPAKGSIASLMAMIFGINFFTLTTGLLIIYVFHAYKTRNNPAEAAVNANSIKWRRDMLNLVMIGATLSLLSLSNIANNIVIDKLIDSNMPLIEKFASILMSSAVIMGPSRALISLIQTLFINLDIIFCHNGNKVDLKNLKEVATNGLKHALKLAIPFTSVDAFGLAGVSFLKNNLEWQAIFLNPAWDAVLEAFCKGAVATAVYALTEVVVLLGYAVAGKALGWAWEHFQPYMRALMYMSSFIPSCPYLRRATNEEAPLLNI